MEMKKEIVLSPEGIENWFADLERLMAAEMNGSGVDATVLELANLTGLTDFGLIGESSGGFDEWASAYLTTPPHQQPSEEPIPDFDAYGQENGAMDQDPEFLRILNSLFETEREWPTQDLSPVPLTPPRSSVCVREQVTTPNDNAEPLTTIDLPCLERIMRGNNEETTVASDAAPPAPIQEPIREECRASAAESRPITPGPPSSDPTRRSTTFNDVQPGDREPLTKKSKVDPDNEGYAFPMGRVHDDLQEILNYGATIDESASMYMVGVLESLVRDTLERIIGRGTGQSGPSRLELHDVFKGLQGDECLRKLTEGVVIPARERLVGNHWNLVPRKK